MNKQHLIQEFDKYVKELKQLDYPYRDGDTETVYFGYKTNRNNEIFTVTDWGNVRKFVEKVYASAKREVIEEVLKMKQEAYNEQEAITFDMLNDIVYMGGEKVTTMFVDKKTADKITDWWLQKFHDYQTYLIEQGEGMALEKRKGWEQLDEYQKIVAIAEIKAIEDYQNIIRGK